MQIDKQNYVEISVNNKKKDGFIETKSTYLNNTKITSSDLQQKEEKMNKKM